MPDDNNTSPSHTSSQPSAPQTPKSPQGSTTWEGDKDLVRQILFTINTFRSERGKTEPKFYHIYFWLG